MPLLVGLVTAAALNLFRENAPIINFGIRVDLGMLLVLTGVLITLILGGVCFIQSRHRHHLQRTLMKYQHDTAQTRRRFLSHLDHEMKNSLTAQQVTLAYLQNVSDEAGTPRGLENLSIQVERLRKIVTDLRKLAELEEQTLERQPVAMDALLEEVLDAIQAHPNYDRRRVRFTLLQSPWELPPVQGDRVLLSLACYNLLDNALKFTEEGDSVEVRAFEMDDWLVIEVADNGLGIPEEDLPYIFEELYRGSNTQGRQGSGLGLALVQTIVKKHLGTVTVRSQIGEGTVFTLRLPTRPRRGG